MDEDQEKPWLTCQPCSDKLPMILSSEGVVPTIQVPASIAQYLKDYQRDGVRFLYKMFATGMGGILADDMGLGKTIQAIAFMAAILQMKGTKEDQLRHCSNYIRQDIAPNIKIPSVNPVLIVCPASLTDNWNNELVTWGYFKVFKITSANRSELINRAKRKECDALLITFETARICIDYLNMVDWSCIFVDEVHRLKDTASKISQAFSSFRCKLRYGFTGTPFQNNLKELWCLLNWSNPHALGDLNSFTNDISRLLELGQRRNATKGDKVKSSYANLKLSSLRRKFMLRRPKSLLAKHLPPKTDQIVFCELTPTQQNIYRSIVESPDVQKLLGYWKDKCNNKTERVKKKAGLLFTYLHLLLKTANHVGLLMSVLTSSGNEVAQQVCRQALEESDGLSDIPQKRWPEILSNVEMSGKMKVLAQLLPALLEKGDKILIFSYSTKLLDLVQKYLIKMRYKFSRLDGTTPPDARFELVRSFNTSPSASIFLLSTKAGGVGLNITGANVVIIFDPNWNPAHDMQAQDRAYRLGQERSVQVYRLLSSSTIEEFVYLRQLYKQQLASLSVANKSVRCYFNSVSGDSRYYGELFGIRNLFSFRDNGQRSLTEELIEKQQNLEKKLRLKLEAPSRDTNSGVYISSCAISEPGVNDVTFTGIKSGLTQLCEEEFELFDEDQPEEDSEEWQSLEKNEDSEEENEIPEDFDEKEEENVEKSESIGALLERTDAVRIVVEHDQVMAPSTVEDFVSDCAIRDVLQKGVNPQLPAFDCSVGSQGISNTEELDKVSSCTTVCRLKFSKIAKSEYLTPYELATKVISMSANDKLTLLNKHQKTKQCLMVDPCMKKRCKQSGLTTEMIEAEASQTIPSDEAEDDPMPEAINDGVTLNHTDTKLTKEDGADNCNLNRSDLSGLNATTTLNNSCSDQSETASSFEQEVSMINPYVSKEAIAILEKLICNKSYTKRKKRLSNNSVKDAMPNMKLDNRNEGSRDSAILNQSGEEPQISSLNVKEKESSLTCDTQSDPPLTGAALIESLFFGKYTKPSPKKRICPSSPLNCEASTSGSNVQKQNVVNILDCKLPKLQSSFPLNEKSEDYDLSPQPIIKLHNYSNDMPKYKSEDDVFRQLLKSGKLKHV